MQEKVHWAELRWDLKNRVTIYQRADKAVYSAESTKWGQVILKVNENKEELFSEYNMLKLMVGENSCKVFAYDKAHSVLVEERIMPGNRLKEEQDVAVRMAHFLRVFSNIHQSVEHDQTFTTYLDWLKEAEMFCRQHDVEEWILSRRICVVHMRWEKNCGLSIGSVYYFMEIYIMKICYLTKGVHIV